MEFRQLVADRRSVRVYDAAASIEEAALREILTDAQQAPSWKNSQTARYHVALQPETIAAVREALPGFNQARSANVCAYIVTSFVRKVSGHDDEGNPNNELGDQWGAYDLGLASAYLILSARDHGYDTLIMGLRDADALRTALDIPANEQIAAVIALGKRTGEPQIRPRVSLEDVAVIK